LSSPDDTATVRRHDAAVLKSGERMKDGVAPGGMPIDFQALVEGIEAITWEMDTDEWLFTYVSPQAEAMLGYPQARWLEPAFWNEVLVHPDDAVWAVDFCVSATQRNEDHEFEYRAKAADGRTVWLKDLVRVVPRPGRSPLLRGVMIDITSEKEAQAQAEELRRELLEAQELAHIGSWQWIVGDDKVTWSDELYRIYGLDPKAFGASFGAYLERVHPDDRERVQQTIGGLVQQGGFFDFEERIVRPDGDVRHLRSRGQAVVEAGRVVRLVGSCQDVTDQKESEERSRKLLVEKFARKQAEQGRQRLQRLFEQAPAAIAVVTGPDLVFESINDDYDELLGGRDVLGKPMHEALPEVESQGFIELMRNVYRSGERFIGVETPATYRLGDGSWRTGYFDFVYEPLTDDDDQVYGVMMHAVDVTEKVAARQELEQLTQRLQATNEELEQFAYVTSHDLRAPLRGIASLATWIEEDVGDALPDRSREHLELLRSRVSRLEGLIDGILQYSRAGRLRAEPETVDVREMVEGIVDLLAPPEGVIRIEGELPVVQAERVPFQQVLQNLIGNALKHGASDDPRVTISATEREDEHEITVADNGPGIDPRYQDRIWTIFQTLKTRDEVEGTGVGLSLVKKIVESRGGRVALESQVGQGASFSFTWPKG